MKSNTYFKDTALDALKGNWLNAVLATLVYLLIVCLIAGPGFFMYLNMDFDSLSTDPNAALEAMAPIYRTSTITFLVEVFLLFPLVISYLNSFRKLLVNRDSNLVGNTLDFTNYWNKVGAMILMYVFIFLWSLLFIIPGIIKTFSYAMTPYIFWLWLSFIGWGFLCLLTCGIGTLWLNGYMYTATAAFYEEVKAEYALNGGLD